MAQMVKETKKEVNANWSLDKTECQDTHRKKRFFKVSLEDKDYLKDISEAQAKLETCVVPSVPCLPKEERSGKPVAIPSFCSSDKLEAMLISNSVGLEVSPQHNHMDQRAENDLRQSSTTAWCTNLSPSKRRLRFQKPKQP